MKLGTGVEIRGQISWREGGPAAGLPLRAHQQFGSSPMVVRARTNAAGEFRIGGLYSTMSYRLEIDADRYKDKPLDLIGVSWAKAGRTDVVLQVTAAILVSGTLYRPSGKPARRWHFWLVREGSPKKIPCRTRNDGSFNSKVPEDGTYNAWTHYIVNGKRHQLACGSFRSGDSGVILQIPQP